MSRKAAPHSTLGVHRNKLKIVYTISRVQNPGARFKPIDKSPIAHFDIKAPERLPLPTQSPRWPEKVFGLHGRQSVPLHFYSSIKTTTNDTQKNKDSWLAKNLASSRGSLTSCVPRGPSYSNRPSQTFGSSAECKLIFETNRFTELAGLGWRSP